MYNTHLIWEDQNIRMQQMRDVLTVMEEDETSYKVLTGDFNAQESNDEFDAFCVIMSLLMVKTVNG